MRKSTLLGVSLLLAAGLQSAKADEPSITIFDDQYYVGGFMPQCISANGKYVCGSSYSQVGFISDWQNQNHLICSGQNGAPFASTFTYITNEGLALSNSLINFETGKTQGMRAGGYVDMMTEDGSIVVGMTPKKEYSDFGSAHYIEYQACYWENGVQHLLPIPTEEELGYYYLRTRARCISSDGSVILGEIVDRLYLLPMILWYRQEDGSYKMDAVCEKYFSDIKYNDGYYKEYSTFQGCALSKNGKWVAMILRDAPEYGMPATAPLGIGLYNVETGEIKRANITEEFGSAYTPRFFIYYNGVSDNGTIAGYYMNNFGGESAFIMYEKDMTPRNFIKEFHTIGPFADYDENGLNRVSSITPDGRYIIGYGWQNDSYEGYVFDTGETDETRLTKPAEPEEPTEPENPADPEDPDDTGIGTINADKDVKVEYYNVAGQKVDRPERGIYIVRYPDGSAKKIIM